MRTFPELVAVYRKFLVIFTVLIFLTNFDQFTEQYGVIPLYWIFVTMALYAPAIAMALFSRPIHIAPIIWWSAGFLIVSSLWYYRSLQSEENFQAVQTRYLSVIFIGLALFILSNNEDRRLAQKMAIVALLIGVTLNIYELFNPMTFSQIEGRSVGLFANPNQSGQALVLAMICGFGVLPSKWRPVLLIVAIAGIMPTFSRSGMLAWAASVMALYLFQGVSAREFRRLLLIPVIIVAFIYSPVWSGLEHSLVQQGVITPDIEERLNFIGSGGEDIQDASAIERQELAKLAWTRFKMSPWLGWGTGSFYVPPFWLGPHNTYLAMMVDYGLIGILIYPCLLGAILIGVNRESARLAVPLVIALFVQGFFSHNLLEQRATLLAATLAAATVDSLRTLRAVQPAEVIPLQPRLSELG
jgi:O-antigen ligase